MCEDQAIKRGKCVKTKLSRQRNVWRPRHQNREMCEDQAIKEREMCEEQATKRAKCVKTKVPREENV